MRATLALCAALLLWGVLAASAPTPRWSRYISECLSNNGREAREEIDQVDPVFCRQFGVSSDFSDFEFQRSLPVNPVKVPTLANFPQTQPGGNAPESMNLCATRNGGCGENARCTPAPSGNAVCACEAGATGRPPNCVPGTTAVNACATNNGACGPNALCAPTPNPISGANGVQCACLPGSVGLPPNCRSGNNPLPPCAGECKSVNLGCSTGFLQGRCPDASGAASCAIQCCLGGPTPPRCDGVCQDPSLPCPFQYEDGKCANAGGAVKCCPRDGIPVPTRPREINTCAGTCRAEAIYCGPGTVDNKCGAQAESDGIACCPMVTSLCVGHCQDVSMACTRGYQTNKCPASPAGVKCCPDPNAGATCAGVCQLPGAACASASSRDVRDSCPGGLVCCPMSTTKCAGQCQDNSVPCGTGYVAGLCPGNDNMQCCPSPPASVEGGPTNGNGNGGTTFIPPPVGDTNTVEDVQGIDSVEDAVDAVQDLFGNGLLEEAEVLTLEHDQARRHRHHHHHHRRHHRSEAEAEAVSGEDELRLREAEADQTQTSRKKNPVLNRSVPRYPRATIEYAYVTAARRLPAPDNRQVFPAHDYIRDALPMAMKHWAKETCAHFVEVPETAARVVISGEHPDRANPTATVPRGNHCLADFEGFQATGQAMVVTAGPGQNAIFTLTIRGTTGRFRITFRDATQFLLPASGRNEPVWTSPRDILPTDSASDMAGKIGFVPTDVRVIETSAAGANPRVLTVELLQWAGRDATAATSGTASVRIARTQRGFGAPFAKFGGCPVPILIHEIGHLFGLDHTHARTDITNWFTPPNPPPPFDAALEDVPFPFPDSDDNLVAQALLATSIMMYPSSETGMTAMDFNNPPDFVRTQTVTDTMGSATALNKLDKWIFHQYYDCLPLSIRRGDEVPQAYVQPDQPLAVLQAKIAAQFDSSNVRAFPFFLVPNAQHRLVITATGGDFTLDFQLDRRSGFITRAIRVDTFKKQMWMNLQTAFDKIALENNVHVTPLPGTGLEFMVSFIGSFGARGVPLAVNQDRTTGGAVTITSVAAGGAVLETWTLRYVGSVAQGGYTLQLAGFPATFNIDFLTGDENAIQNGLGLTVGFQSVLVVFNRPTNEFEIQFVGDVGAQAFSATALTVRKRGLARGHDVVLTRKTAGVRPTLVVDPAATPTSLGLAPFSAFTAVIPTTTFAVTVDNIRFSVSFWFTGRELMDLVQLSKPGVATPITNLKRDSASGPLVFDATRTPSQTLSQLKIGLQSVFVSV